MYLLVQLSPSWLSPAARNLSVHGTHRRYELLDLDQGNDVDPI